MLQAIEQAHQVAPTPVTVLLRGESGTGKELFAHAIHNASTRYDKPFVRVNCAALPRAFSNLNFSDTWRERLLGQRGRQKGLFHEADGGTLFFDEIGAMDISVQASLLLGASGERGC